MLDSINASPYIGFYLEVVDAYQLGWERRASSRSIEMPGYAGSTELSYARPAGAVRRPGRRPHLTGRYSAEARAVGRPRSALGLGATASSSGSASGSALGSS